MSKKKSNNTKKEKVNSSPKNSKKNSIENQSLNDEKKTTNFEEQINIERDKFLRLFAEFENYKKRTTKERIELFTTANQELMLSILPVIDDFERAINQSKASKEDIAGFILIKNKFFEILKSKGLSSIEISIGDKFDSVSIPLVTAGLPLSSHPLTRSVLTQAFLVITLVGVCSTL